MLYNQQYYKMNIKMIKITTGLVALAGLVFGVYKYVQNELLSKIKEVKSLDIQFVKKWISIQDLENYNKSYTAVLVRGEELPNSVLLKLFLDINKLFVLCIYDKNSNSVVTKEMFLTERISEELGNEDIIEFPFE